MGGGSGKVSDREGVYEMNARELYIVELYKTEEMSISKAAELAGVSTEEMKDFLAKAEVKIRRGFPMTSGEELSRLM